MVERGQPAVLFRLEFGGGQGWGHLVRSGALASELRRRGWRCDLWTASRVEAVLPDLREPFDRVIAWDGPASLLPKYEWLVVDHYGTDDESLGAWRCTFPGRILVIDDEARRSLVVADLVLNARPGLDVSCYPAGVPTLLGERYALLRRDLQAPRAPEWKPSPDVMPVLVMLGGTDPQGATEVVLHAIADVDADHLVPVVVRPGGSESEALARFGTSVWLDGVNARELAGWAGVCRFAVSAAGGTLHELAALHLPFVSVIVAENQRLFAAAAEARWGMPRVPIGPTLRGDLAAIVRRLKGNLETARAALSGVDGRGAERVADRICQGVG
jgi:spore coat polysaccharide biosynthesis predicted glycosyltransferase SpsG